jgi:hypothetical protein
MRMRLLGTVAVMSARETLVRRLESADISSLEEAKLYECQEELAELIFLSVF